MAGELMLFGIEKLSDLLGQECERFQGFENQVAELQGRLSLLKSFVKDADAKKHTEAVVKNCVEKIKEIISDGEDIIEIFLDKEKLGEKSGIKKSIGRLACIIPYGRGIALKIEKICTRISDVIKDMTTLGLQQSSTDSVNIPMKLRETFPNENESNLVGLEANVKKYLVEQDNAQVVSITGMGGLGKTTLARQVFNDEVIKHQFDGLAWVCVSQDCDRKKVWQTILTNLKPKEEERNILEMTDVTLQRELYRFLETSKSLIVLDDIWKVEDWDLIRKIFSSKKGWKVLLTSRKEILPVRRDEPYINLNLECLSTENSWKLFQRIALPRNDASEFMIDKEMEEMGTHMVNHCGGLPLAIEVLGGLLASKYTRHDWERLSKNIGSRIVGIHNFDDDNNSQVYHVLSLSFEELPSYLKQCFLYLAYFPEDYKADIEKLCYHWAADGVLKPSHYGEDTIRDVGHSCIEELVRRNMVIAERDYRSSRFETCHLHDMMREICLLKAKEENFLQITNSRPTTANFQSPGTSRRLFIQIPTTLHVKKDIKNQKLRSLVVICNDLRGAIWELSGSSYKRLQLLRVLDLSGAEFKRGKLPASIGKLIHLRYLSLKWAKVSRLPYSLRNLKLLIYLNLYTWESTTFVPNVLMGMQELKYLELPPGMHKKTKLELKSLEKLETLKNFSTKNCILEDLCGMARLRILSIWLNDETSLETLSASISGLKHLEYLCIEDLSDVRSERMIEDGIVLDFVQLKQLELNIYSPRQQHFPSHLTLINLWNCRLEEDPMPILEKLLQLKVVYLYGQSFIGRRMVCSDGGFPQLQELEVYGLDEWEEWIVEEGSMPLLHTLDIFRCPKLKELPDGLRFIHSLKKLEMDKEWKERLSEGGEDYYKVKHIPCIDFPFGKDES